MTRQSYDVYVRPTFGRAVSDCCDELRRVFRSGDRLTTIPIGLESYVYRVVLRLAQSLPLLAATEGAGGEPRREAPEADDLVPFVAFQVAEAVGISPLVAWEHSANAIHATRGAKRDGTNGKTLETALQEIGDVLTKEGFGDQQTPTDPSVATPGASEAPTRAATEPRPKSKRQVAERVLVAGVVVGTLAASYVALGVEGELVEVQVGLTVALTQWVVQVCRDVLHLDLGFGRSTPVRDVTDGFTP